MIVVSDASPILSLSAVGRLNLLHDLFGEIVIPPAVRAEILAGSSGLSVLAGAPWIEARALRDQAAIEAIRAELDDGEAEAIGLALELNADLLLIDERRGRAVAERLGLRLIGLLGSLIQAKRQGMLYEVKPIVDELIESAGFRVSAALYAEVLEVAGE